MSAQCSAFSPFGVFRFSAAESPCERHYNNLRNTLGDAFQGPVQDALTYALGMALGVMDLTIEGAAAQADPNQVTVLLPDLEKDHRLYPLPGDSDNVRRARLAEVMAVGYGGTPTAIEDGLAAILGTLLIDVMWLDIADVTTFPASVAISPESTPLRYVTLDETVFPGSRTVSYTALVTDGNPVSIGDVLTVDPGQYGLEERVTVTDATSSTITATFANIHESGARATTGHWPHWGSDRRQTIVIVDESVLSNPSLLARVEWFLRRMLTGASTWVLTTGTAGNPTHLSVGSTVAIGHSLIAEPPS
jgi:hypothetical protein